MHAHSIDSHTIQVPSAFSQDGISESQAHFPASDRDSQITGRTGLQTSLGGLREQLRAHIGTINNLRTRNQVHERQIIVKDVDLQRLQAERTLALEMAQTVSKNHELKTRTLMILLGLIVLAVFGYCYWCWCHGPEMLYIRQRRLAVLFE